jgi:lipoprotein-anchoring transpeptidase ErfK/SrfK
MEVMAVTFIRVRKGAEKMHWFQYRHARVLFALLWALTFASFPRPVYSQVSVHTVQPGETLGEIAKQYGLDVAVLRRLNGITDANHLWVGQTLTLPGAETRGETREWAAGDNEREAPRYTQEAYTGDMQEDGAVYAPEQPSAGRAMWVPNDPDQGPSEFPEARFDYDDAPSAARQSEADGPSQSEAFVNAASTDHILVEHIVRRGEQLEWIADRYNLSTAALLAANPWVDGDELAPGQRLYIPMSTPGARTQASWSAQEDSPAEPAQAVLPDVAAGERWIDVDLSSQRAVAYEGTTEVRRFIISSGVARTPTVTGSFAIYAKTPLQDMSGGSRAAGDYYFQADVPWVQYFYDGYSFHGAYWHNNFGRPTGHGCINMRIGDAEWLYGWSTTGTRVEVHE